MPARKIRREVVILGLVCVLLRLSFIVVSEPDIPPDGVKYDKIALNWINGHGYRIDSRGELTGLRPPLYPMLLGFSYYAFGHSYFSPRLFQALLDALTGSIVYLIAVELGLSVGAARLAFLLFALYPPFFLYANSILTETPSTFLLMGTVYLALRGTREGRWGCMVAVGLLSGLAALCKPTFVAYPAVIVSYLLLSQGLRAPSMKKALAVLVPCVVVLLPWIYRNYVVFGRLTPLTTVTGYLLWTGNYPPSDGTTVDLDDAPEELRAVIRGKDEAEVNDILYREAFTNMRNNSGKSCQMVIKKFFRFWFNLPYPTPPSGRTIALAFGHLGLLILAALGVTDHQLSRPHAGLFMGTVVYVMGLAMIFVSVVRYSAPIMPLVMILGANGVVLLTRSLDLRAAMATTAR